jgi:hypothetical protein
MPQADDLPQALKKFARRQGIEISHNRFDSDAERLTRVLSAIDGDTRAQSALPNAGAALPIAAAKPAASARWLIPIAGLAILLGGAGFFYEQHGAHEATALREERAKPASDVLKTLPPPETNAALNGAAPSPSENAPNAAAPAPPPDQATNAAAPPLDNAPNAAAPAPENALDRAPTGKIADSPPSKLGKASTPDAPAPSQQWLNIQDFSADYQRQIDWNYPDKAWGRCQNGVSQRGAHWSPRPAGQYFLLHGTNDRTFRKDSADLTAKGFKMQYDNVFQECDGSMHHQTLWMKEG